MKKRTAIWKVKKGAAVLAMAVILGGCGSQDGSETKPADAVTEATADGAVSEAEDGAEKTEEAPEGVSASETAEADEKETKEKAEAAGKDAAEDTEEKEAEEDGAAEDGVKENAENEVEESAAGTSAEGGQEQNAGAAEETVDAAETAAETAAEMAAEPSSAASVTPASIYAAVGNQVALPSMIEGDDNFISNYYGINPADLDGYVFASAEDPTLADSVIIMKAKSGDGAERIVAALNTVIEQKAVEMENYLPEQYAIVAKSSVKTEGDYIYLVISAEADSIESVIRENLK